MWAAEGRETAPGSPAPPDCRQTGNRSAPRPPRECRVRCTGQPRRRRSVARRALTAPYAVPLRFEELRDVLPLAQSGLVLRRPTMLEIRPVVRRPNDAPHHAGNPGEDGRGRFPFPVSPFPFSPPSHILSPPTAPRARLPSCDAIRPATIPGFILNETSSSELYTLSLHDALPI